jgi:hypothetical protein
MANNQLRFTHQARQALRLAEKFATEMHHSQVKPEYILVGLIGEEDGVAFTVVKNFGISPDQVVQLVKQSVSSQEQPPQISELHISEDTKHVLECAVIEAQWLGHYYIGTHHLLLGILSHNDNLACKVLEQLHLDLNGVRKQVGHILQEPFLDELTEEEDPDGSTGLSPLSQARQIRLVQNTVNIYGHILSTVTQEQAVTWRDQNDNPGGWTLLDVLYHVADFDEFVYQRTQMILMQDFPHLPAYDHDALAVELFRNKQDKDAIFARFTESRARLAALFESLSSEKWERAGLHPEYGHLTLLDVLMHVAHHDVIHLEQMMRIIADAAP